MSWWVLATLVIVSPLCEARAQGIRPSDFTGEGETGVSFELTVDDKVDASAFARFGGTGDIRAIRLPFPIAGLTNSGGNLVLSGTIRGHSLVAYFDGLSQGTVAEFGRFQPVMDSLEGEQSLADSSAITPGIYLVKSGLERRLSIVFPSDDEWGALGGDHLKSKTPDIIALTVPPRSKGIAFAETGSMFDPQPRTKRENTGIVALEVAPDSRGRAQVMYALPTPAGLSEVNERILKGATAGIAWLVALLDKDVNRKRYRLVVVFAGAIYALMYVYLFWTIYKYDFDIWKVLENVGFIIATIALAALGLWMKGGVKKDRAKLAEQEVAV